MAAVNSSSELTRKQKAIELLRWVGVLPAAILARLAVPIIVGNLMRFGMYVGWFSQGGSGLVYYLQLVLFYFPKEAAFVIAGAKMAPRYRLATCIILAVAAILMSLIVHMLGQSNVGLVNYMHFAAESLGAVCGAVYMFFSETGTRRNA